MAQRPSLLAATVAVYAALLAALWLSAVDAQTVSVEQLVSDKETSVNAAVNAFTQNYTRRCLAYKTCQLETTCPIPACGSTFPASRGFACYSSFGTDSASCGASCNTLVRSLNTSVVRFPPYFDVNDPETSAFMCYTNDMHPVFDEARTSGRIQAWQYIADARGTMRIYPGSPQGRDSETGCSRYDARVRPWYQAATTGPKDVVIIVDATASMGRPLDPLNQHGPTRLAAAQATVSALLGTLQQTDRVTVVAINSSTHVLSNGMLRGFDGNLTALRNAVNSLVPVGDATWSDAFTATFNALQANSSDTANCNRIVSFFTDGVAPKEDPAVVAQLIATRQAQLPRKAILFTYSISAQAEVTPLQTLACANEGVWGPILTVDDPVSQLEGYFRYLARGVRSDAVRWTSIYVDDFGLGEMVTAARAIYDSNAQLVAVMGVDITLRELGYDGTNRGVVEEIAATVFRRSLSCTPFNLTACDRQAVRKNSPGGFTCPATPTVKSYTTCETDGHISTSPTCAPVSGGVNALLCEPISDTNRRVNPGFWNNTEVQCCHCNGAGKGRAIPATHGLAVVTPVATLATQASTVAVTAAAPTTAAPTAPTTTRASISAAFSSTTLLAVVATVVMAVAAV